MRGLLVAAFLLGITSGAKALTGDQLLRSCEISLRTLQTSGENVTFAPEGKTCWVYMTAVQDLLVLSRTDSERWLRACPDPESTLGQLVRVFTLYALKKPARLHERASGLVMEAMWEAFPCN